MNIHADRQTDRWTDGQTDRRADGQAGRRAGGQAGRRAGGQAGRRAGRQTDKQRQIDSACHLILDAKIKLQLKVLDHEILQAFLDDAGQHDAKREAFEQLTAQQYLDGLPLSEQALGPINMLFPRLQISANTVFPSLFVFCVLGVVYFCLFSYKEIADNIFLIVQTILDSLLGEFIT